mmetsp:Transcript_16187/g.41263  ORF Transcript_16187/g.41263 Transcript_16187/m.41263 type:complete len:448 (-) Transcript_16187:435-1778(-)
MPVPSDSWRKWATRPNGLRLPRRLGRPPRQRSGQTIWRQSTTAGSSQLRSLPFGPRRFPRQSWCVALRRRGRPHHSATLQAVGSRHNACLVRSHSGDTRGGHRSGFCTIRRSISSHRHIVPRSHRNRRDASTAVLLARGLARAHSSTRRRQGTTSCSPRNRMRQRAAGSSFRRDWPKHADRGGTNPLHVLGPYGPSRIWCRFFLRLHQSLATLDLDHPNGWLRVHSLQHLVFSCCSGGSILNFTLHLLKHRGRGHVGRRRQRQPRMPEGVHNTHALDRVQIHQFEDKVLSRGAQLDLLIAHNTCKIAPGKLCPIRVILGRICGLKYAVCAQQVENTPAQAPRISACRQVRLVIIKLRGSKCLADKTLELHRLLLTILHLKDHRLPGVAQPDTQCPVFVAEQQHILEAHILERQPLVVQEGNPLARLPNQISGLSFVKSVWLRLQSFQ